MFAFAPPPHITSQMHWVAAVAYMAVLPLSIWIFKIVITRGFPFLLPRRGQSRRWTYAGLIVCTLILGTGFVSAGKAVRSLCNYTLIDDQGLHEVSFRHPTKLQVWGELVGAQLVTRTTTLTTNGITAGPQRTFDGVVLKFKEGNHWEVKLTLWSDVFPEADFKAFVDWLKQMGKEQANRRRTPPPMGRASLEPAKPQPDDIFEFGDADLVPKK